MEISKKIKKIKYKTGVLLQDTVYLFNTTVVKTTLACRYLKELFKNIISFLSYPVFLILPVYIAYGKIKEDSFTIEAIYRATCKNDLEDIYNKIIEVSGENTISVIFDVNSAKNISFLQYFHSEDYLASVKSNIEEADKIYKERCKTYFKNIFSK